MAVLRSLLRRRILLGTLSKTISSCHNTTISLRTQPNSLTPSFGLNFGKRSFATDAIDFITYVRASEEIASKKFENNTGSKLFYVDLKKDPKGEMFIKLSERSRGRKSSLHFGIGKDFEAVLDGLTKAPSSPRDKVFKEFQSDKFPDRLFKMKLVQNALGRGVMIEETNPSEDKSYKVFMDLDQVDVFKNCLDSLAIHWAN